MKTCVKKKKNTLSNLFSLRKYIDKNMVTVHVEGEKCFEESCPEKDRFCSHWKVLS